MNKEELRSIYTGKDFERAEFLDLHGRSSYIKTQQPYIHNPVISDWLIHQGVVPAYPKSAPFACCITHDVDHLFTRNATLSMLKAISNGNFERAKALAHAHIIPSRDPLYNLSSFLEIERDLEIPATYFFLALDEKDVDFNYHIDKQSLLLESIKSDKHEVGLHGGHRAPFDQEVLIREKNRLEMALGCPVTSYRSHYLKYEYINTWERLKQAGFNVDAGWGYANMPGFKNGLCHPFYPYNENTNQCISLAVLPLMMMDVSLFGYLKLDPEQSFTLFKQIVTRVKLSNGVFTLLWHNNYLTGEWFQFYKEALSYLKEQEAWFATVDEVVQLYQQQDIFCRSTELLFS